MRVLILNNDKSYGALLASASKKLGHVGIVKTSSSLAMQVLQDGAADIVLVELEMPAESGIDFANEMVMADIAVPLAFCIVGCQDQGLIAQADSLGQVLPKIWTHSDLRKILKSFQRELKELDNTKAAEDQAKAERTELHRANASSTTSPLFRSTPPKRPAKELDNKNNSELSISTVALSTPLAPPDLSSPTLSFSDINVLKDLIPPAPAKPARVYIALKTWAKVIQLCKDAQRGSKTVVIRARSPLHIGQEAQVALGLPDDTVVSISARVLVCLDISEDGRRPYNLDLIGLGTEEINYLLSRAEGEKKAKSSLAGTVDLLLNDGEPDPHESSAPPSKAKEDSKERTQPSLELQSEVPSIQVQKAEAKIPKATKKPGTNSIAQGSVDSSLSRRLQPPSADSPLSSYSFGQEPLKLHIDEVEDQQEPLELLIDEEEDQQELLELMEPPPTGSSFAQSPLDGAPLDLQLDIPLADGSVEQALGAKNSNHSDLENEVVLEIEEFPTSDLDPAGNHYPSNFEKGGFDETAAKAPLPPAKSSSLGLAASRQAKAKQTEMIAQAAKAKNAKVGTPLDTSTDQRALARQKAVKDAIAKRAAQAAARAKANKLAKIQAAKAKRKVQRERTGGDIAITFNSVFPMGTDPLGTVAAESPRIPSAVESPAPAKPVGAGKLPSPRSIPSSADTASSSSDEGDALISWSKPRKR